MSAVPIPQGATVANAPSAQASVPIPANAVVESQPGQGVQPTQEENASDTRMSALSGMTGMPTPNMSAQQKAEFESGKEAGTIAGARDAATMAVAGPLLSKAGAAVDALTASKPVVQQVGTGILDSVGKEIMKDVVTEGPSILDKLGPKAIKLAISTGASALGLKWLMKLGGQLGLGVAANAAYDRLK